MGLIPMDPIIRSSCFLLFSPAPIENVQSIYMMLYLCCTLVLLYERKIRTIG